MKRLRFSIVLGLAALLVTAPKGEAQKNKTARTLSIGYVYPAGGAQGASSEHVVAGQYLEGVTAVHVSGGGVKAEISEFIGPISGREQNELRLEMNELLLRKAVIGGDSKLISRYQSYLKAGGVKVGTNENEVIPALKRKYAGAAWKAEDDRRLGEVRKRLSSGVRRPANPTISNLAVCQFTVAPDAEPGWRELRVATPRGLSNPLAFHIGQVPEFSEVLTKKVSQQRSQVAGTTVAPKSTGSKPEMTISVPAAVNGQILPGELDRFRFSAVKGQKLVVSVNARRVIPYISDAVPGWFQATLSLYDADGRELAYQDDFRFDPDPVIYYEIPADGDYFIEIKDSIFRGREDFVYRVMIGETPFITSVFPLGGPAGAETAIELAGWNLSSNSRTFDATRAGPGIFPISVQKEKQVSNVVPFAVDTLPECLADESDEKEPASQAVELPVIVNGRIEKPGDADVFSFEGKAGEEIVAEVMARRLNSPMDSVLQLTDASGRELAFNDDHTDFGAGLTTHHADSYLRVTLPEDGSYRLRLGDTQHRGGLEYGYRLRISPPRPDFVLRVTPSTVNARAFSGAPLTVHALRRDGFDGEIAISVKDSRSGFSVEGGTIPAGEKEGKLSLKAPSASRGKLVSIELEGRATIDGKEIARAAVPADDRTQAFENRHLVVTDELKVAVLGSAKTKGRGTPVKILSELPVMIPAGGASKIRLAVPTRNVASKARLKIAKGPQGITIGKLVPMGNKLDVELRSDAAKVKPGFKGKLIITAYGPVSSATKKKVARVNLPPIPFEITGK